MNVWTVQKKKRSDIIANYSADSNQKSHFVCILIELFGTRFLVKCKDKKYRGY